MKLAKRIGRMNFIPVGYGMAYVEEWSMMAVCYPFPLNKIIGPLREWYIKHSSCKPSKRSMQLIRYFEQAKKDAWRRGYDSAKLDKMREEAWMVRAIRRLNDL